MLLKDKNILVGISSSIAIYKSLELIRLYIKQGANVKVIMTKAAEKFITPLTFEAISQNKVLCDETESWDKKSIYNHIDIGKWADIFVIAPATANTINKLANGIADNLLTQTVLAYPKLKLIAPAANTNMIQNQITVSSLEKLKNYNFKIISSQIKELACKDVGDGAMAEPDEIFYETSKQLLKVEYWNNREVIISGGGTLEKIDDVRYISNFSSGKMASSLAKALYLKGAKVTLVSSRGYENLPKSIKILQVSSTNQMFENLKKSIENSEKSKKPFLFMAAAVSDYIPPKNDGKLKKENLGETWNLQLSLNIDILNSLEKKDIITIGFKAEMDKQNAKNNATSMIEKKNIDGVCLNIIDEENYFGSDSNIIEFITKNGSSTFSGNKFEISMDLINKVKDEFVNND
ncbi:bifunctional phosphopantothenoylcysteine decarboxylase/phosphopantothenate--cysteine ligase CoaBC [Arcobacter arenosus]|uniref:Coenzyme A biosynthesis bifunctional protein CoaBC n=1 Tax=Arcobacter arenosus TaxID=2576037 RepID=A0A5R8Y163_9BACT|nr:bifunctional phosphopantothenoylcysteine decarboxylase/phosphopantothenate--cysteine ligase CoaBC [Arcobacter arenosus]TLP38508.1 bifunctional phosphopantothenoylcysteine decarboxylase/phosphopantothenate--cysteine ligase CoaBC [Arcobacter arenosus]